MLGEQTICLPPRTTAFTAVCDVCAEEEDRRGRSYLGATFQGTLRLEDEHGYATCRRGHRIRILRATPALR